MKIITNKTVGEFAQFSREIKYRCSKGYIYIMQNACSTGFLKIGKTQSLYNRLRTYNAAFAHFPCSFTYVSPVYDDHDHVETQILRVIQKTGIYPVESRREYFDICHESEIMEIILAAENEFLQSK